MTAPSETPRFVAVEPLLFGSIGFEIWTPPGAHTSGLYIGRRASHDALLRREDALALRDWLNRALGDIALSASEARAAALEKALRNATDPLTTTSVTAGRPREEIEMSEPTSGQDFRNVEQSNRVEALGNAVRYRIKEETPEQVVEAARKYFEFLQGAIKEG